MMVSSRRDLLEPLWLLEPRERRVLVLVCEGEQVSEVRPEPWIAYRDRILAAPQGAEAPRWRAHTVASLPLNLLHRDLPACGGEAVSIRRILWQNHD